MAGVKLAIAADHAGFQFKEILKTHLAKLGFPCQDFGTHSESSVDYPDYANLVCQWWLKEHKNSPENVYGLLICGSGQGMAMQANKYQDIRAALCWSVDGARLSREHNDANILCLASRLTESDVNIQIVETFVNTAFLGGRHLGRVQKLDSPTLPIIDLRHFPSHTQVCAKDVSSCSKNNERS